MLRRDHGCVFRGSGEHKSPDLPSKILATVLLYDMSHRELSLPTPPFLWALLVENLICPSGYVVHKPVFVQQPVRMSCQTGPSGTLSWNFQGKDEACCTASASFRHNPLL